MVIEQVKLETASRRTEELSEFKAKRKQGKPTAASKARVRAFASDVAEAFAAK